MTFIILLNVMASEVRVLGGMFFNERLNCEHLRATSSKENWIVERAGGCADGVTRYTKSR